MNNKIIIVAGVIFACVFILLLAIMFSTISNKTSEANNKVADTFNTISQTNADDYAKDALYKGSEVVALIQNVDAITGSNKSSVIVKNTASGTGATYNSTNRYTASVSRDKSSDNYINPTATYKLTEVKTRNNGTIESYTFVKQ